MLTQNHQNLIHWLESFPQGVYIQVFGDSAHPTEKDIQDAKNFGDGMRKNIGKSGVASVEVSYNRCITKLLLVPSKV